MKESNGHRLWLDTGVELFYVDQGHGRPVVFIPGWMASTDFFAHQLPHVARTRRAISYDPRSQGRSSCPGCGNTFTQRGRDLAAFLATLDLRDAVLVGWSYGAYDAYAYLRDFGRDRVAAMVVVDQPPRSWASAEDTDSWSESPLSPDGLLAYQREALDNRRGFWTAMITMMLDADPVTDADGDVAWMVDQGMRMPAEAAALILMDGTTSDFSEIAERTSRIMPTLVYANTDALPAAEAWVAARMPAAELAETPTHLGFFIDPEPFNARLDAFLAGLDERR